MALVNQGLSLRRQSEEDLTWARFDDGVSTADTALHFLEVALLEGVKVLEPLVLGGKPGSPSMSIPSLDKVLSRVPMELSEAVRRVGEWMGAGS